MNWLKKFWITFLSFLPLTAAAITPLAIGAIGLGVGIIGYSIYRSVSPVNVSDALSFFTTCWSCQLFSSILGEISTLLPITYKYLGRVIIPIAIALTGVWFALQIAQVYIGTKKQDIASEPGVIDAWSLSGKFGSHIVKVLFVSALLAAPLPRMISSIIIQPVFDIGLSLNYTVAETNARQNYANCIIATAIADRTSIEAENAQPDSVGAFAPRFRHNLTCQISNVHQMTGLGMTVGWTMLNMAFNYDYMHKILVIPIFPNIPLLATGLLVLVLYFMALLPIPLYFLEIFVKLAIDFILLPLTLLSWLFQGWKIFPNGKRNFQQIVDDVVSGALGLAMTGIFLTFSIMVLNRVFGNVDGTTAIQAAIAQNDSKLLIDSLMNTSGNKSLITIILLGIFMTMFMNMIPALIKSLFNVTISDKYYQTAKKDVKILWDGAKQIINAKNAAKSAKK